MSFAIWLTGLPACGKSAIARELARLLHLRGLVPSVLESDALRTQITPYATYDEAERDLFYAALVELARERGFLENEIPDLHMCVLLAAHGRPGEMGALADRMVAAARGGPGEAGLRASLGALGWVGSPE